MRNLPKNLKTRLLLAAGALMLTGGVYACIGSILDSVHFNDGAPDFGSAPPPVVLTVWGETQTRSGATQNGVDVSEREDDASAKAAKDATDRRDAQEKQFYTQLSASDFEGAKSTAADLMKGGMASDPEAVIDIAEVLAEGKTPIAEKYVAARVKLSQSLATPEDKRDPKAVSDAQSAFKAISEDPSAGSLKAHALYALAGIEFDARHIEAATTLYRQASTEMGSRRERSLIMSARCLLWSAAVPDGKNWDDAAAPSAANLDAANATLDTLLKDYPTGHFAGDAEGLKGRIAFFHKQYPAALAIYLRRLENTKSPEAQAGVLASIRATSQRLNATTAKEVQDEIVKDPSLLQPYLDYRLYHTSAKPADLKNLLAFASKVTAANPETKLSAGIYARMAEVSLVLHDWTGAGEQAAHSLSEPAGPGDRRDLAYYVRGGVYAHGASAESAIEAYREVLKVPGSYLHRAARENLALEYEASGQWNEALQQYEQLDYTYDIAYLLDIRLSPAQIQAITEARGKNDPKHDLLVFSLGMRYLRMDQLEKARDLFASIPAEKRDVLSHKGSHDYAWNDDDNKSLYDSLYDPLATANDLIGLRAAVASAKGDEAKASALYALGSYYYTHRNLLMYNASLWEGGRNFVMGSWYSKIASKDDNLALQTHNYEHESISHARVICLSLVKQYPKSAAAPKALYRAATASRRLANFNGWWRERNKFQNMYEEGAKLLDRLAAEYPASSLAKNARKYANVFREEGKGEDQKAMFAVVKVK